MNKTEAIKQARKNVSTPSKFGDNYHFLYYDTNVSAWRHSNPTDYQACMFSRSQTLIEETLFLMGYSNDICNHAVATYFCGKWEDHLKTIIEKFKKS